MLSELLLKNEFGQVRTCDFSDPTSRTKASGLSIVHAKCHGTISLYGGHVTGWQPTNQKPVFWMSDTSLFGDGKAIRGGVPICFPWFGPFEQESFEHTKNTNMSVEEKTLCINHGFARTSQWDVDSIDIQEQHVKVVLVLAGVDKSPAWQVPFELKQEIILGESFSQHLFITNKSSKSIEYTGALHSYFSVSSPVNTNIDQLSEVKFDDKLTGNKDEKQHLPHCVGPLDRIYYSNSTMDIVDTGWKRKLTVEAIGGGQWVLWNPGKETAETMADVHGDGENEYVCLEAANTKPVLVGANSTVTLGQTITISSM